MGGKNQAFLHPQWRSEIVQKFSDILLENKIKGGCQKLQGWTHVYVSCSSPSNKTNECPCAIATLTHKMPFQAFVQHPPPQKENMFHHAALRHVSKKDRLVMKHWRIKRWSQIVAATERSCQYPGCSVAGSIFVSLSWYQSAKLCI